jgi:hypothetical protein
MTTELENQTLSSKDLCGLPVDTAILFSNHKNIYKRRIEKRQRKLLQKILFIHPFLHEGEKILHVTTGCSPVSVIEQLLTGWIVFYLKRSLFVFTNKRIFHIPTKSNFSYRNSISQILYGDCQKIALKGRTLVIEYKNGQKEKFVYIAGKEKKKIKAMLQTTALQDEQSPSMERTHLCPRCMHPLIKDIFTCPSCSLEFKNKTKTKKISIICPGGGYFYTRHPFLGLADAFAELYLSLLVLIVAVNVLMGNIANVGLLGFFAVILAMEKALTVYHSNHFINEYIPKDRQIQALSQGLDSQQSIASPAEPKAEEILSASWTRM